MSRSSFRESDGSRFDAWVGRESARSDEQPKWYEPQGPNDADIPETFRGGTADLDFENPFADLFAAVDASMQATIIETNIEIYLMRNGMEGVDPASSTERLLNDISMDFQIWNGDW